MLQGAIIESRLECERHCGIFRYDAISCMNCNFSRPACFGYNCESSEEWEAALKGLFDYINKLYHPAMLNFRRINATMSETWRKALASRKTTGWQKYRNPPTGVIDC
nr:izumo sperm-egg fusion protein 4 isoform X4 [Pelodiscus sinensis]|eukprot:XP_006129028.1 izumo sperm-egg fusion protein 4 isoform X4 [Pelodiscus sinensis]